MYYIKSLFKKLFVCFNKYYCFLKKKKKHPLFSFPFFVQINLCYKDFISLWAVATQPLGQLNGLKPQMQNNNNNNNNNNKTAHLANLKKKKKLRPFYWSIECIFYLSYGLKILIKLFNNKKKILQILCTLLMCFNPFIEV